MSSIIITKVGGVIDYQKSDPALKVCIIDFDDLADKVDVLFEEDITVIMDEIVDTTPTPWFNALLRRLGVLKKDVRNSLETGPTYDDLQPRDEGGEA